MESLGRKLRRLNENIKKYQPKKNDAVVQTKQKKVQHH